MTEITVALLCISAVVLVLAGGVATLAVVAACVLFMAFVIVVALFIGNASIWLVERARRRRLRRYGEVLQHADEVLPTWRDERK